MQNGEWFISYTLAPLLEVASALIFYAVELASREEHIGGDPHRRRSHQRWDSAGQRCPCSNETDTWGRVDPGAQLSAPADAQTWVHVAFRVSLKKKMIFFQKLVKIL